MGLPLSILVRGFHLPQLQFCNILRMYSDLTGSPYGGATVIDFSTSTFNGPTQVADALLNVAAFILFSFSNVSANLIVFHSTIST
jgi:hypothetical protein